MGNLWLFSSTEHREMESGWACEQNIWQTHTHTVSPWLMCDHKKRRILFYHFIWIFKYNNNVHAGPFYQTTVWLTQFNIHIRHLVMLWIAWKNQKKRARGREGRVKCRMDECVSNLWPSVTVSYTYMPEVLQPSDSILHAMLACVRVCASRQALGVYMFVVCTRYAITHKKT